jgi:2-polyprenyl-6-methoxyphenol hydroxylase-like FAD-dependent oxidoreductase
MKVVIAGAGIGGLTLALSLHEAGIDCELYEAAPEIAPLGAGVNLLPHSIKVLSSLGLLDALESVAVETTEAAFFNRHGQFVHREPAGRFAGYDHPQLSIHRADIQLTLLDAVRERIGETAVHLGHRATGFTDDGDAAVLHVTGPDGDQIDVRADALVGADGVHSVVRRQLWPDEGDPRYSGVTMWRGTVEWDPYLTGASMIRVGWLTSGKMVIYPVRPVQEDGSSTGSPRSSARGRSVASGTGRARWRTSSTSSRTGPSTGWTWPGCCARRRGSSSTRWSTRTPSTGGPSAASRSSATPPTR